MAIEIERKFLVNKEKWEKSGKGHGEYLRQGYILTDPAKTIRIRIINNESYLTIKGINESATRKEFEYKIPNEDAEELFAGFTETSIVKIRYKVNFNNKVWEVDGFLGENEGLLLAEIELLSEKEPFDLPDWVAQEVTGEEKYYNSYISIHPFKTWVDQIN